MIKMKITSRQADAPGPDFRRDAQMPRGLTRLSRCETLLERGFYRCLNELLELQAIRRGVQHERQNEPGVTSELPAARPA